MSATRIHSKISKVVNNPKNNPIFTHKVVAHPKNTHKNILKVVTTCKIPNTIQSQICPYHKDTYCPQHTNKNIILSVLHAHTIKLSTSQNIVNTTLLHSYPHNNIKLSTPSHIVFNTTSLLAQKTIPFQLFHNSIPCKTSTATIISLLLYNLDHSIIMKCHCKAVFADSSEFIYRTIIIFKTPK